MSARDAKMLDSFAALLHMARRRGRHSSACALIGRRLSARVETVREPGKRAEERRDEFR